MCTCVVSIHVYANTCSTHPICQICQTEYESKWEKQQFSDLKKPTAEIPLATELSISNVVGHVNCMAALLLGVKLLLTAHCTLYNNLLDSPCLRVWGIPVSQIKPDRIHLHSYTTLQHPTDTGKTHFIKEILLEMSVMSSIFIFSTETYTKSAHTGLHMYMCSLLAY